MHHVADRNEPSFKAGNATRSLLRSAKSTWPSKATERTKSQAHMLACLMFPETRVVKAIEGMEVQKNRAVASFDRVRVKVTKTCDACVRPDLETGVSGFDRPQLAEVKTQDVPLALLTSWMRLKQMGKWTSNGLPNEPGNSFHETLTPSKPEIESGKRGCDAMHRIPTEPESYAIKARLEFPVPSMEAKSRPLFSQTRRSRLLFVLLYLGCFTATYFQSGPSHLSESTSAAGARRKLQAKKCGERSCGRFRGGSSSGMGVVVPVMDKNPDLLLHSTDSEDARENMTQRLREMVGDENFNLPQDANDDDILPSIANPFLRQKRILRQRMMKAKMQKVRTGDGGREDGTRNNRDRNSVAELPAEQLLKITLHSRHIGLYTDNGDNIVRFADGEAFEQGADPGDEIIQVSSRFVDGSNWTKPLLTSPLPLTITLRKGAAARVARGSQRQLTHFDGEAFDGDLPSYGPRQGRGGARLFEIVKPPSSARFAVQAAKGEEPRNRNEDQTVALALSDARINKSDSLRCSFAGLFTGVQGGSRLCAEYVSSRIVNSSIANGLLEPNPATGKSPHESYAVEAVTRGVNEVNQAYLAESKERSGGSGPDRSKDGCAASFVFVVNETLVCANIGHHRILLCEEEEEEEKEEEEDGREGAVSKQLKRAAREARRRRAAFVPYQLDPRQQPLRASGRLLVREVTARHSLSNLAERERMAELGKPAGGGDPSSAMRPFTQAFGFENDRELRVDGGQLEPYITTFAIRPLMRWVLLCHPFLFERMTNAQIAESYERQLLADDDDDDDGGGGGGDVDDDVGGAGRRGGGRGRKRLRRPRRALQALLADEGIPMTSRAKAAVIHFDYYGKQRMVRRQAAMGNEEEEGAGVGGGAGENENQPGYYYRYYDWVSSSQSPPPAPDDDSLLRPSASYHLRPRFYDDEQRHARERREELREAARGKRRRSAAAGWGDMKMATREEIDQETEPTRSYRRAVVRDEDDDDEEEEEDDQNNDDDSGYYNYRKGVFGEDEGREEEKEEGEEEEEEEDDSDEVGDCNADDVPYSSLFDSMAQNNPREDIAGGGGKDIFSSRPENGWSRLFAELK
eukprot:jgi/Bigna1/79643/fgenesh1_pg.64_\